MVFRIGAKVAVGPLVYTVFNANEQRTADGTGGLLVTMRVTNASPYDVHTVPALALVDDDGQTYREKNQLAGLPDWMGAARKLDPTQTHEGVVFFQAPLRHFRLRLSDPVAPREVSVDVPVGSSVAGTNMIGTNVSLTSVEAQGLR